MQSRRPYALALFFVLTCALPGFGQLSAQGVPKSAIRPDWVERFQPFKVIGNVYFVGTRGVACFLITTPDGHILLDTGLEESAPQLLANVAALGFRVGDIKIMLSSHAHYDHVAGDALVKARTGARVYATDADARLLESGGREDFRFGKEITFTPVAVDRRLHDGDTVSLGGTTLTAHVTPGHTKGNTTWTMIVREGDREYSVVFAPSMSINPGVKLVNYAPYPTIANDYASSFAFLETLHPDVFLAPHGDFFDLAGKAKRLKDGASANPFIDPAGYRAYVGSMKEAYLKQLRAEQSGTDGVLPCAAASR